MEDLQRMSPPTRTRTACPGPNMLSMVLVDLDLPTFVGWFCSGKFWESQHHGSHWCLGEVVNDHPFWEIPWAKQDTGWHGIWTLLICFATLFQHRAVEMTLVNSVSTAMEVRTAAPPIDFARPQRITAICAPNQFAAICSNQHLISRCDRMRMWDTFALSRAKGFVCLHSRDALCNPCAWAARPMQKGPSCRPGNRGGKPPYRHRAHACLLGSKAKISCAWPGCFQKYNISD